MADLLREIFLKCPFSIFEKWEKYYILNWNWTPPWHFAHQKTLTNKRGKTEFFVTKLSGGLLSTTGPSKGVLFFNFFIVSHVATICTFDPMQVGLLELFFCSSDHWHELWMVIKIDYDEDKFFPHEFQNCENHA